MRGMTGAALLLGLVSLAACDGREESAIDNLANGANASQVENNVRAEAQALMEPLAPPAPGAPGGLPVEPAPAEEGAIDPDSAQGAAQVVQGYYGLLEEQRFSDAQDLWNDKSAIGAQDDAIKALDKTKFHALDDEFHRQICIRSGLEFAWELISENKGHMDRVRILSLEFALRDAWDDHVLIFNALSARDPERAAEAMQSHMARILRQIDRIRAAHVALFEEEV